VTTLSTHVLDVERGVPAKGVPVALHRGADHISTRSTNAEGRIPDVAGGDLAAGVYRLTFDVAEYFHAQGRAAPFLQSVTIEFEAQSTDRHYHVPLLVSPYACTSYRGS
jgi:5-hydroxyisourate hydrolase